MLSALYVFLGGGIGALLRFGANKFFILLGIGNFPWATLLVNVVGCFFMGICAALFLCSGLVKEELRLGLMIGLLGGMTTFSSFSLEVVQLWQAQEVFKAIVYLCLSNLLALIALVVGLRVCGS